MVIHGGASLRDKIRLTGHPRKFFFSFKIEGKEQAPARTGSRHCGTVSAH
ncbi:hypothetical protein AXZ77_3347 [Thioclava sp. ES.031]|nr:hypothetical protein AXZ77_3347 [Thioclava sp. ES.031]